MEQEVRQAMSEAAAYDQVRWIVLTGAGRGFCAGADMSLLQGVLERSEHPLPDATASQQRVEWGCGPRRFSAAGRHSVGAAPALLLIPLTLHIAEPPCASPKWGEVPAAVIVVKNGRQLER